jgi:hypothetical protein
MGKEGEVLSRCVAVGRGLCRFLHGVVTITEALLLPPTLISPR